MTASRVLTLNDCCEFIKDGTHSSPIRASAGIPVLSATNVNNGRLCLNTDRYTNEKEYASYKKRLKTEVGDVLLTIVGTIGRTAIVNEDKPFMFQRSVAVLRAKKELVHNEYLRRALESRDVVRQLDSSTNRSAQAGVYLEKLKAIKIPLPPLETQKHIARVLEQADQLRKQAQQMETELNQLAQSLFLDMFGDPVENPRNWPIMPVNHCCTEIVDCINRTAKTVSYKTPYKMIRTTNIRDGMLSLKDIRYVEKNVFDVWIRRLKPKFGDVLFTREAPAGEAAVIEVIDELFLGQRIMHYRPDKKWILPNYLKYELMGAGVKQQIDRLSSGSTVVHLSVNDCKEFEVRVPPIEIQHQFEDALESLKKQKAFCQRLVDQYSALFESLMQRAFKGELTSKAA